MATSGVTTFNVTRNEIVTRALRISGALSHGQIMDADMLSEGIEELNSLVKTLQADGVQLWSTEWIQQTLTASDVVTGTDSSIYKCIKTHTSAADNKPVTGANYKTFWSPDTSTPSVWATATTYSSIAEFTLDTDVLDVEECFVRQDSTDSEVTIASFRDFLKIYDKKAQGRPAYLFLQEGNAQHTVQLYPYPDNTNYIVNMYVVKELEDFVNAGDNPDFNKRWIDTLTYGLAERLSHIYQMPLNERDMLMERFQYYKSLSKASDMETIEYKFIRNY